MEKTKKEIDFAINLSFTRLTLADMVKNKLDWRKGTGGFPLERKVLENSQSDNPSHK